MKRVKYYTYQKLLRERSTKNQRIAKPSEPNDSKDLIHIMNELNLTCDEDKSKQTEVYQTSANYDLRERKSQSKTALPQPSARSAPLGKAPILTPQPVKRDCGEELLDESEGIINLNSLVNPEWLNEKNPEKSDIK